MGWLKILASALGLAEFWSKYFGEQKNLETGAKLQQGANDAETIKTILDTTAPVSGADIEQLWSENKAKFGPTESGSGQ